MATLNPREEVVGLMRGYFACPLMTALGKRGVCDFFLKGPFKNDDIPDVVDRVTMKYVLNYLTAIGLLEKKHAENELLFEATELGHKIFKRYGSFVLLHSYREMIEHMDDLLFEEGAIRPGCDRLDNVIGSGLTNGRKFFPKAIDMMKTINPACIADVACGDGGFLRRVIASFPDIEVVASDLSEVAIRQTAKNIQNEFPGKTVTSVQTDAGDVPKWASVVSDKMNPDGGHAVISMWYLIHEISQHDEKVIVDFLTRVHDACPNAHLIIGEIVNLPDEILVQNRHGSIMPEFLLFHDVSGQGVLTWEQLQEVLRRIPYELQHEARFDLVEHNGTEYPTGIVWHLQPKQ